MCLPVPCGTPESSANSEITIIGNELNAFTFGRSVKYTCNEGFELENGQVTEVRKCTSKGVWSPSKPECQRISCGKPGDIEFGSYIGDVFTFGAQVIYVCNPGYELKVIKYSLT